MKLLIVEDDPAQRRAIERLLMALGHCPIVAGSGREALDHAERNPDIDLVIADYHLTDGEKGLGVIASLRAKLGASIPAALLTGDTSLAVRAAARRANVRFATKPLRADEVLAPLEQPVRDNRLARPPLAARRFA